jgi:hypothetical protein
MKVALRVVILVGIAATVFAAQPLTDALREQVRIEQALLDAEMRQFEDHRGLLQEAWVRVERGSADLQQAEQQGESLDSLMLRDEDLRLAESELLMHLLASQRLRRSILVKLSTIETTEEEIRRLEGEVGRSSDPITGTWRLAIEPGGHDGLMYLQLQGTLIQGTYRLSGDWTGSVRGTFVSGRVRLERIDSQIGFASIMRGRLDVDGGKARLLGTWEATQLASGMPGAGNWVAERVEPEEGEGE